MGDVVEVVEVVEVVLGLVGLEGRSQSAECNEDKELGCRRRLIYDRMEGKEAPETDLGLVPD